METQDKKLDCSPKQGRLRIRLSDAYPLPVREALQKLALATHGCDQAVEYVLRLEREAFQYFRPIGHCFGENLDRWLAGQPDRLSRIEEIKQQVGAQREQVGTFTDRDKAPGRSASLIRRSLGHNGADYLSHFGNRLFPVAAKMVIAPRPAGQASFAWSMVARYGEPPMRAVRLRSYVLGAADTLRKASTSPVFLLGHTSMRPTYTASSAKRGKITPFDILHGRPRQIHGVIAGFYNDRTYHRFK